jgi:soluble lytic murein transglycosylase-like protein
VITQSEPSAIPLVNPAQHHSSVHCKVVTAIVRTDASGRPRGRRNVSTWMVAKMMAGVRLLWFAIFLSGALLTTVLLSDAMAGDDSTVPSSRSSSASSVESYAPLITEASRRFAIPAQWIRGVMQLESAGNGRALSPKGALGLMQIMPGTWVELSVRYGLGIDPFDPHDNIMAGAAYLREMHDRFGSPGFLAAYNAGPERYEQHLVAGRPLPPETQAYVAALGPLINRERWDGSAVAATRVAPWRQAPLFPGQFDSVSVDRQSASTSSSKSSPDVLSTASSSVLAPHAEGLFVRRSNEVRAR